MSEFPYQPTASEIKLLEKIRANMPYMGFKSLADVLSYCVYHTANQVEPITPQPKRKHRKPGK